MGLRSASPLLLLILILLLAIASAHTPTPKNVQTSLRAKWFGTPLLLEAGELLSKEEPRLFWNFIHAWLHADHGDAHSHSARSCVNEILHHSRPLLREPLASLFEFSLILRSASPALVLYRQLAHDSLSSHSYAPITKLDPLHLGVSLQSPGGKCCWVDTGDTLFFDVSELLLWLQTPLEKVGGSIPGPQLFDFDHVHFDSSVGSPVAVLYGALGTVCFKEFHDALVGAAKQGKVNYILRPVLPAGCETNFGHCGSVGASESINLGGYGVELAFKNMEYKAMDDSTIKKGVTLEDPRTEDLSQEVRGFIFSKILERKPELTYEIMTFRDYLLSSTVSDTLDVWELKDLGHQTVQRIVRASDPLQSMQDINQNFPNIVSSLSRMKLDDSVRDEIMANQRMIPPGKSLMAINGALVNVEDVDLYLLIDLVHQDLLLADQFSKLKIPPSIVRKLLSTLPPSESSMFRVDFRTTQVHYLNNLEEDAKYKRWRSNLNEILMPVFPGQLRHIRKNLFHAVFVLDPATISGLESIDMIISLYESDFPVRFGVVLYSSKYITQLENLSAKEDRDKFEEDISDMIIRLFSYIKGNHDTQLAFEFLSNVNKLRTESDDGHLELHHVEGAFVETILPKVKSPPQEILLKLEKESELKELSQESSMLAFKLGLSKTHCSLLMNGLVIDPTEDALLNALNDETQRIQEQVYFGQIKPHTDVLAKFLSEAGIQRYNPRIISDSKPRFVSLSAFLFGEESILNDIEYLHSPGTMDELKPVTHLLAVDITSRSGLHLLRQGLNYLREGSKDARIGLLFSANWSTDSLSVLFVKVFEITSSSYSHKKNVLDFLDQLCLLYQQKYFPTSAVEVEGTQTFIDKVCELAEANGLPSEGYRPALLKFSADEVRRHLNKVGIFLHRLLGSESGVNAVFTNGRVTYPIDESTFLSADLLLLESIEFKQRTKHILEIIEEVKWQHVDPDMLTSKFISDIVMAVSSSMAVRERSSESARFEILNDQHSAIILHNENSSIHIDACLDPLSATSQKLSGILRVLWKYIQPSMRIVLNPLSSLADLPLKNYYRYVVPSMDDFSIADSSINGPKAFFANMPLSKTLTMNLDVPEPWLVEPVIAVHDLDNILLENLGDTRTLQAVFELEALVLTGHCSEKDHDPPRGLQLILGTKTTPHLVDTIVMANLGYWQRNQIKDIINSLLPACQSRYPESNATFKAEAIIANPPAYGHTHVAEYLKVPLHIFFTMPWTPTSEFPHPLSRVKQPIGYRVSYQVVDALIWLGIRDMINEFRKKKLKLKPVTYLSGSYTHPFDVPHGYIWSPHLVPKPKDWGHNIDVVGFCFLDLASNFEPPKSLVDWLEEGEKPIYVGFGSLPLQEPEKMTKIIIQALEKTGQRGIINKGWGGLGSLAEQKKSVYLLDNCPHDWLFPQCSAVVHHGGAGTTAAGLRAECPTTIVPFFGDQPFWGDRVHARGVGPAPIPVDEFTLDRLVDAIHFMLKPEVKRRAVDLANAMKNEDGVLGAVKAFYKHYPDQKSKCEFAKDLATKPKPIHKYFCLRGCFGFSTSSVDTHQPSKEKRKTT